MSDQKYLITKKYSRPFILTRTKLSRIVEVFDDRFDSIKEENKPVQKRFIIELSKGRQQTLFSLEEVFSLDNALNNKIISLYIEYSSKLDDYQLSLSFDDETFQSWHSAVRLEGLSENGTWLNEAAGALEEQVERTLFSGLIYYLKKFPDVILLIFIVGIVFLLTSIFILPQQNSPFKLSPEIKSQLLQLAENTNATEDQIEFIYRYMLSSLQNTGSYEKFLADPKTYFIAVPILIMICAFIYLWFKCYPVNVFEWGDWEVHHNKLLERRKTIWIVIIISLCISVLANLFVFGLIDLIKVN